MAKRKSNITKSLLDSAVVSSFAAIEIHSKPRILYRYLSMNKKKITMKVLYTKYDEDEWTMERGNILVIQVLVNRI